MEPSPVRLIQDPQLADPSVHETDDRLRIVSMAGQEHEIRVKVNKTIYPLSATDVSILSLFLPRKEQDSQRLFYLV